MRLGGPVFLEPFSADGFVAALQAAGYRATYWPGAATGKLAAATVAALKKADIVIAEVGAWSNPMDRDETKRREAIANCKAKLAVAEEVGARTCVNIVGSKGAYWHGPCADDLTADSFDQIVATTRDIIDAVKPKRTKFALETMPWLVPDSPDEYLRVLKAIDRPGFGVHLDPVNLVNCPRRYFNTGALIRECFEKLGPHIRSCHAKDISLSRELTVHLSECAPGQGALDYPTFLRELAKLDPDTPLMLEHLQPEQYPAAAAHVRAVATQVGVTL